MEPSNLRQQVPFPPQEMATRSLEEMLYRFPNQQLQPQQLQQQQEEEETMLRPKPEQALQCPRCNSTNTKFCYYNNYSLNQPRHYCKTCRRYWTQGGALRNVPVGGGSRKNKRPSSSTYSKKALENSIPPPPPLAYDPNHLTLSFARLQNPIPEAFLLGNPSPVTSMPPRAPGFLDLLRSGMPGGSSTSAFNNLSYSGFGAPWNAEEVRVGAGSGVAVQGVPPFDELGGAAPAAIGQGAPRRGLDGENRPFMGLQSQVGGDGNPPVDQGRDFWNGGGSSSWQGLVN